VKTRLYEALHENSSKHLQTCHRILELYLLLSRVDVDVA
jgi:hypothetical protein